MKQKRLHISDRQLFDFLNERASEAERKKVKDWLQQGEEQQEYFEKFKQAFEAADAYPLYQAIDVAENWKAFKLSASRKPSIIPLRRFKTRFLKVAASILLLFSLAYLTFYLRKPSSIYYEYATGNSLVLLPDSTEVYLQPGARLEFKEDFDRRVSLEGEAFFAVQHDPQHPFSIALKQSEVKVLGTSFNLKSGKDIEVKLYEGSIRFKHDLDSLSIVSGEQLVYHSSDHSISRKSFQNTQLELDFKGLPFSSIAALLEQRFLYKIQLSEDLKGEKVSARFSSEESIEGILQVLSNILEFNYNINKRYISIEKKVPDTIP
jgi:ferric-dicitrate binding protein FerR (iron transport regulator)